MNEQYEEEKDVTCMSCDIIKVTQQTQQQTNSWKDITGHCETQGSIPHDVALARLSLMFAGRCSGGVPSANSYTGNRLCL